jgi:hypothetical protein
MIGAFSKTDCKMSDERLIPQLSFGALGQIILGGEVMGPPPLKR